MKKPGSATETTSTKKKQVTKKNRSTDKDPIIHNQDSDSESILTFTGLPEKIRTSDWSDSDDATTAVYFKELKISSSAFNNNERIPINYTCDGLNVNPPLEIDHLPAETQCLAIIVDDPDASKVWAHWLAWNVPVTHHIKENEIHGIEGINDFNKHKYQGPCPPSETHHYFFKVYALNSLLQLKPDAKKPDLEKAMSEHIIGFGQLIGTYKRPDL